MLYRVILGSLCAMLLLASVWAEDVEKDWVSGLQPGERIGAFHVIKHAGAKNDDVRVGKELCYRCKLGRRPVVVVFARTVDEPLVALIRQLDKAVAKNEKKKLASFCSLLGEDVDHLAEEAKRLVKESEAKNIALVVPVVNQNGPKQLKLNEDADVTVLLYVRGNVKANHAFAKGQLNEKGMNAVIADIQLILEQPANRVMPTPSQTLGVSAILLRARPCAWTSIGDRILVHSV